jgi:glutathione S-transferase
MILLTLPLIALALTPKRVTFWNSGTCPYAQRAWIALKEKGIQFDFAKVDLADKEATPGFGEAYYKANPNKISSSKVPVVVVETEGLNMKYYTESKVLLETLDELFPEAPLLLPADNVDQRYRSRVFGDVVYDSIWGGDRSPYRMAGRKAAGDGWNQAAEEATLCEMLKAMDDSLACFQQALEDAENEEACGGPFVLGEHFSMAECVTAPFVQRADFILKDYLEIDLIALCQEHGYHRVAAWWAAVLERPSVVETASPDPKASTQRIIDMISDNLQK